MISNPSSTCAVLARLRQHIRYDLQKDRCFSGKQGRYLPVLYDSMLDCQSVHGASRNPYDKQG